MAAESISFQSKNAAGDGQGILVGDRTCKEGLICVHEWWGSNDSIRETGKELSRRGFLVLVPDMYRGKVAKDFEEAGHLMGSLDWQGACLDISGAAVHLKSLGCAKVGVTGYCMGGALALAAGVLCPEVTAISSFYGIPKPSVADLDQIRTPTQGHWGRFDDIKGFSSPDDYLPLEGRLKKIGVPLEWNIYEAKHAFANPQNPTNYDEKSAKEATDKLEAFMHTHLQ